MTDKANRSKKKKKLTAFSWRLSLTELNDHAFNVKHAEKKNKCWCNLEADADINRVLVWFEVFMNPSS